ncbi:hypothetical protein BC628DRAFT_949533 [Trametes gibbosa]|nr:hypothetical protein BC628DRAFT_949533 [Trametes gibbosa]
MAQSGYSTFYQAPSYPYSAQAPPSNHAQTRVHAQYQGNSYPQPVQPTPQTYGYGASPTIQRPPSRISPSPLPSPQAASQQYGYFPGQNASRSPSRMGSSPLPQNSVGPLPQQYGQQYRPPPSPQPYATPAQTPANPYPSPISPQGSQMGTPQSARRPLPHPRGLPPAPQSAGFAAVAPRPPPSPQPTYATHRPTQSVPSVFPSYPPPNPNTYPTPSQEPSPTSSAFSTTSTSPPRPLPLPRSTGNMDLSYAQQAQSRPQSPPKRALPEPGPSPTREPVIQSPEPVSASGQQKFVPLWKRALPQPVPPTSRALPSLTKGSLPPGTIERRSTVSSSRPLPPSPNSANGSVVSISRNMGARAGILPPHLQLPNLSPTPKTPGVQSPNVLPATPQPATPQSSRFALRERSRTLPLASAAPNYPLPPKPEQPALPSSPRKLTDWPISQSPPSSDDEELTNALLERHPRSPSPQFGIRDLPRNSQSSVRAANGGDEAAARARRELPSPVPAPHIQAASQREDMESSLAFRMASASMQPSQPEPKPSFSQPGRTPSNSVSSPNTPRPMPQPPANAQPGQSTQDRPPQPQTQRSGWPNALPPLPRAPTSPQPTTQSTFAQVQARSRPLPARSNNATGNLPPFAQPRSPRKVELDLSLDDAPPPSLRRSPTPGSRSSASFNPQPPQMGNRAGTAPAASGVQLRREPSQDSASVFSLSSFPQPPTHVEVKPQSSTKSWFRPPSPDKSGFAASGSSPTKSGFASSRSHTGFGVSSPTKPGFGGNPPTKSSFEASSSPKKPAFGSASSAQYTAAPSSPPKPSFQPPSPTKRDNWISSAAKPQFNGRAPSPTKHDHPTFTSPERSHPSPRMPKISFPANPDGDSDEDDGIGGPVINISGPGDMKGGDSPSLPRFSFGDDGHDDGVPSINIGGVDDGPSIPQISLPGESSSPTRERRDRRQTRKIQETLSNPRIEAAKRSGLVCGGCGGAIIGRIVSAMDMRWHPGCFRCCVCDELLENLSSYAHDGRPYCHLDYHERFAPRCYHCQTAIVDERFITLDDHELGKRTYHEQHFFCAECGDPFLPPADPGAPSRTFAGDGEFAVGAEDDVGFTVYRGHPYCETCHVRLRMPKCKKCKKSIRDGMQAVEALGGKWCWECFTCASCNNPFEDPAFFQRDGKPFCERCFSIMIRNEI